MHQVIGSRTFPLPIDGGGGGGSDGNDGGDDDEEEEESDHNGNVLQSR